MTSRRPHGRGVLLVLVAVVVAVAGCATVPGSSEVSVLRRVGDAVEPTAPPGPVRGAGPLETVRGWVMASGATDERHEAARAFLTPQAAGRWDDGAAPTVVGDQVDTVFGERPARPGQASVRVRATRLGVLTAEGSFQARPGQVDLTVGLTEANGQWRISSLPAGTVVRRADLGGNTRPVRTWFVDPVRGAPVADPRYLSTSPARSVVARTLQLLLAGPSQSLAGAAVSALPPGAALRSGVTTAPDGATVVDLAQLGALDAPRRTQIAQQVGLTLAGVGVPRVRLLADGRPLLPGRPDVTVEELVAQLPPAVSARRDLPVSVPSDSPVSTAVPGVIVVDGRVRTLEGAAVGGPAGAGEYEARSAGVSPDGRLVGVVAPDPGAPDPGAPDPGAPASGAPASGVGASGAPASGVGAPGVGAPGVGPTASTPEAAAGSAVRLLAGQAGAELSPTGIEGRTVTRPTWSPGVREVWTAVDGVRVARAVGDERARTFVPTPVDARALTALGPVTALRFSPDGIRLAAVVGGRVAVGAVARDAAGGARVSAVEVLRSESLAGVLDVGWTRTDRLVAVGGNRPVAVLSVDGLGFESGPTTNLTPPVTAVAAAPGRPLVAVDQSGTWTLPEDGSTGSGAGEVWRSLPAGRPGAVPAYPG